MTSSWSFVADAAVYSVIGDTLMESLKLGDTNECVSERL